MSSKQAFLTRLFLTSVRTLLFVKTIINVVTITEAMRKNGLTGTPIEANCRTRKTMTSIVVVVRLLIYTLRVLRSTEQTDLQKTIALVFLWNMVRKSSTVSEVTTFKFRFRLDLIPSRVLVIVVLAPPSTQPPYVLMESPPST